MASPRASPLHDGYVDHFDSGCNTDEQPFFHVSSHNAEGTATVCGTSGWYLSNGGQNYRDTDWYTFDMGITGAIDITLDAEYETAMYELGPQDCTLVSVLQTATAGPCQEAYMTITGYPQGAPIWFWVGSATHTPPPGADTEYDYVCLFSGFTIVDPVEPTSWSRVKALFE